MDDLSPDELKWRKRFLVSMAVRLASLCLFFLGIGIAYFDIVRPGGWPQVGAIVAIVGAIDMIFAPRVLHKMWRQQDSEG